MSEASAGGPTWKECMELLDRLPGLALERRAEVIEQLVRNPSPGIRERALRVGAAVLPDERLVDYLRSESDAVLRNAGLEILKDRGSRSFALAVGLLKDGDPDVVLQAVMLLDHIKNPRAVEPLRAALHHRDQNVAQAAIVAVGHLGDARAVPDLLPFLDAEPWLQLAAIQALGDLRSADAVEPLAALLTDLTVGSLAAEALAQIGGDRAFRALAGHWLRFHEELDPETSLGLLAHVLEGLPRFPEQVEGLRPRLGERLRDPFRGVRVCAARCLLAMGPGPEDGEALHILGAEREEAEVLPGCLTRREDLVDHLLEKPGLLRSWGFLLLARHPGSGSPPAVAAALRAGEHAALEPVLGAIARMRDPELAEPILDLYLSLPGEDRSALAPLLEAHRSQLAGAVANRRDLGERDRLVLRATLGARAEEICAEILDLESEERIEAINQLADRSAIVGLLPWREWLESEPDRYADVAGRVASLAGLRELQPLLRERLRVAPSAEIVRAAGELGDREAVPLLLELVAREQTVLRPLVIESLGKIGGPDARRALRRLAESPDQRVGRISYKALAACATEEDDAFFREAISHPDWYVRLACAEVLGRFVRPENIAGLSQLAADPVPIVSRRALSSLES